MAKIAKKKENDMLESVTILAKKRYNYIYDKYFSHKILVETSEPGSENLVIRYSLFPVAQIQYQFRLSQPL